MSAYVIDHLPTQKSIKLITVLGLFYLAALHSRVRRDPAEGAKSSSSLCRCRFEAIGMILLLLLMYIGTVPTLGICSFGLIDTIEDLSHSNTVSNRAFEYSHHSGRPNSRPYNQDAAPIQYTFSSLARHSLASDSLSSQCLSSYSRPTRACWSFRWQ
jgi:hypothetical protein